MGFPDTWLNFEKFNFFCWISLVLCQNLSLSYTGKELEVMKEKGERAEELEVQMQKLERENESLQKKITSLGITCEKVCILT